VQPDDGFVTSRNMKLIIVNNTRLFLKYVSFVVVIMCTAWWTTTKLKTV